MYRGRGRGKEGCTNWWGRREAVMAALAVSEAEDGSSQIAVAGVSWVLRLELDAVFFVRMCCALLLLVSILKLLLVELLSSGCRIIKTHSLGITPKMLRRPFRANTALRKTSSHPAFTKRPHAISHSPKSPPNPPSESSSLHLPHPSCLKAEWLDKGFRVTGQRVFCAYSRRHTCTSCIPRVDPSPLYHGPSYTSSCALEWDLSVLPIQRHETGPHAFCTTHGIHLLVPRWYRVLYVALLFRCFFQLPGFLQ